MTKLTIDIPDELHRAVKSFTSMQGQTIKDYFVDLATKDLSNNMDSKMKKHSKKSSKYISEQEADRMLKPYLVRLIKRIENGQEELLSWEEVKKELDNS